MEYQLPRLIKMWTHLERQAGGKSRGMGEKQIEVDRRLLRSRIAQLRGKLDEVRFQPSNLLLPSIAFDALKQLLFSPLLEGDADTEMPVPFR